MTIASAPNSSTNSRKGSPRMIRRWKKALYLWIAARRRARALLWTKRADRMRAKADALLPLLAMGVMIGGLLAASYVSGHAVQVAGR